MRPEIGFSVIKLIERAGFEVVVLPAQPCCGQLAYNSGDRRLARDLAEKTLREFEQFDYVVVPSGSCGGMIRARYSDLFRDDPQLMNRYARLQPRVFELTDFLVNVAKARMEPDVFDGGVTYHDSCSGLRELGVKQQPRELPEQAGVPVTEMKGCEHCCGFGSTFAVKYDDISTAIVDEKCANIKASGADTVVLGDLGCMLNIEGRLRRTGDTATRVLHIAQVLAGDVPRNAVQGTRRSQARGRTASAESHQALEQVRQRPRERRARHRFRSDARRAQGASQSRARQSRRVARNLRTRGHAARQHGVKKVIKTKSMVSEEMQLNRVLGEMGVQSIETDFGEYILQINDNEPPSHIIAPVVHKDKGADCRPVREDARQAAPHRHSGNDERGARGAASAFHVDGYGRHGRQFSGGGDRLGRGRD
ncbi:putative L-lactate dehydrogenase, Fe-S oxidoreductase subunit YkgE [Candidatus Burkholderia brachyanthoides]|nr:putative L-lactate dehydrogenase, Fe-S oxidoreductase subunit YkgE [Candidatus Burkholderia brachyanthoides]